MFSISEILDLAMRLEKNGENTYRDAAARTTEPALRGMLEKLADDEVRHAEWFAELKETLQVPEGDPDLEKMAGEILGGVVGDQTFSLKEARLGELKSVEEVIERAIEFEEDTVLFYEMLRAFIQDEDTLKLLEMIIAEERDHAAALRKSLA